MPGRVKTEGDVKGKYGSVTGKRLVYDFAKYQHDALPNATYLGFTGAPTEKTEVSIPVVVFGSDDEGSLFKFNRGQLDMNQLSR